MYAVLAVWNDCAPSAQGDYEQWYMKEHLTERISIQGFLSAHRYEAHAADRKYFTWYRTSSVDVLSSPAYLERLEGPTPWTRRIMPAFTNAVRTVCKVDVVHGNIEGAHVVTLWRGRGNGPLSAQFSQAIAAQGITRAQIWNASGAQTPATAESRARPSADALIGDALVAEFTRLADAIVFAADMRRGQQPDEQIGIYSQLCSLHRMEAAPA